MAREHYIAELERTRTDFLQMGQVAHDAIQAALRALSDSDRTAAGRAHVLEAETDNLYRAIFESCLRLVTLQAPVAGDARLITGMLGAIVDLELIGDYADDVAEIASEMTKKPASGIVFEFVSVGGKVLEMLSLAIERWRTLDRSEDLAIRPMQSHIKRACQDLLAKLTQLSAGSPDQPLLAGLILVCKYLERIASHSVSIAEQAAFAAGSPIS
jgi:phosphate transport system protein